MALKQAEEGLLEILRADTAAALFPALERMRAVYGVANALAAFDDEQDYTRGILVCVPVFSFPSKCGGNRSCKQILPSAVLRATKNGRESTRGRRLTGSACWWRPNSARAAVCEGGFSIDQGRACSLQEKFARSDELRRDTLEALKQRALHTGASKQELQSLFRILSAIAPSESAVVRGLCEAADDVRRPAKPASVFFIYLNSTYFFYYKIVVLEAELEQERTARRILEDRVAALDAHAQRRVDLNFSTGRVSWHAPAPFIFDT